MSRKDTILIAVLVNAGLLAILFITAIVYDTDTILEETESHPQLAQAYIETPQSMEISSLGTSGANSPGDEVDNFLKYYSTHTSSASDEEHPIDITGKEIESPQEIPGINQNTVNVTVKRGDSLEKIARANGTTINAIKKANNLQNERLNIGQVLKIPLIKDKKIEPKLIEKELEDPQYYVVKSGDSPWKIAKQFNVKYEDILRLNNLDEEKARNLKIGDRIRVK